MSRLAAVESSVNLRKRQFQGSQHCLNPVHCRLKGRFFDVLFVVIAYMTTAGIIGVVSPWPLRLPPCSGKPVDEQHVPVQQIPCVSAISS